jgi:N-acetylneuraminic acid mutarotase
MLTVIPLQTLQAADTGSMSSWTKLANMPTSRCGLGIAVVSDKIYAIGGSNSKTDLAINEMYDPVADKWFTKASMPTARAGFAIAAYENKIYAIGGLVGEGFTGNVEVYDPISDRWQTLASMPTPRADLTACVVGDKIYLMGGKAYLGVFPYYCQTNVVQVYDIKTDTWSTDASVMPVTLQGYASVVVGSKIYVIGGVVQSTSEMDTSTDILQIYDTNTDNWVMGETLSYSSSYGAAVVTSGFMAPSRIYYVGGFSEGSFSDRVQVYDIEDDFWCESGKMSTSRAYLGLTVVNDVIYVIGGFDGEKWLSSIEEVKPVGYGKVPPLVEIVSPKNNTAYKGIQIEFQVDKAISWAGFSLDGNQNRTVTEGASQTLSSIADGQHFIRVFANDTLGNMGASQTVYFTIDNASPNITILMPNEQTYNEADIVLTFVLDKPVAYLAYILDGQPETPITGNITLQALPNGEHTISIYAIDELGNAGLSDEISFTISTVPIFWIAATIALTIIILSAGYLLIKHIKTKKHQHTIKQQKSHKN